MSRFLPRIGLRSISSRILLWFLAISFIPCAVLTAIIYQMSSRSLEETVRENLLVIAQAKANQVEAYINERYGDANILGRSSEVADSVMRLAQRRKTRGPATAESSKDEATALRVVNSVADN